MSNENSTENTTDFAIDESNIADAPAKNTGLPISGLALKPGDTERVPEEGIALCLSGGGFRAMLFHVGAIWRLNDAGLLPKLARISSVSGGSIATGVLGMNWNDLEFDAEGKAAKFDEFFCQPLRELARHTIDVPSIFEGTFLPHAVGDYLAGSYRKHLFGQATLQDLPDTPRFVFNATNVGTCSLWRFSKPYMADWQVGRIDNPTVDIAVAVAASSAFPPVLSPFMLYPRAEDYAELPPEQAAPLGQEPFTTQVTLTDGGAYDNLGLETAWKRYQTILVSDAGGHVGVEEEPHHDWVRHTYRIWELSNNQVRSLRVRQVMDSFAQKTRLGAYWGVRTDIAKYGLPAEQMLPCPVESTRKLAAIATRLAAMDEKTQRHLINWGYAVTDAALRSHYWPDLPMPAGFPCDGGVDGE